MAAATSTAASSSSTTFDPSQPTPEQAFVFLSKDATGMFVNPASPQRVDTFPSIVGAISLTFSRDGEKLAVLKADGIDILPAKTPSTVAPLSIKRPGLLRLAFSPLGSYLLTWERWQKPAAAPGAAAAAATSTPTKPTDDNEAEEEQDEEEEEASVPAAAATSSTAAAAAVPAPKANDNLLVWSLESGTVIASFQQKNLGVWPSIQWSADEKIAARLSTNELHFYAGAHIGALVRKLRAPGISQFSIAPGTAPYRFCTFIPEKKGQPASIRLHEYPNTGTVMTSKNFFRAQRVALHWNKDGKAVLVVTHTDEDASGRSYYGETGLYLLSDKEAIRVPLAVEGAVYDCAWRPDGKQYAVVYGSTPASITLFNAKSEALIEFPKAHRNTLRWSPSGHILCVAGFGTFAGEVDFWDIKRNALLGSMRAKDTITCDWSPDSKYFLTSTLAPRLKVDNGFKVWNYYGKLVHQTNMDELYQVTWRPAAAKFFDPRPPPATPAPEDLPSTSAAPAAASASSSASASSASSAPAGRYRHPNSRVGSFAEQQVAAEAPKPKKLQKLAPPPQAQERVPVGGALAEPGKKKKKKKAGKGAAPAAKPAAAGFSIQVADD